MDVPLPSTCIALAISGMHFSCKLHIFSFFQFVNKLTHKGVTLMEFMYLVFTLMEFMYLVFTLMEFMYLVFTRMPGESYRRRLGSLLACCCGIFRTLINLSWVLIPARVFWASFCFRLFPVINTARSNIQ